MKVTFPCFSMENKLKLPVISVAVLSSFLGCHIKDKSKSLLFPLHPSIDSQISINLSLLHGLCGLSLIYHLSFSIQISTTTFTLSMTLAPLLHFQTIVFLASQVSSTTWHSSPQPQTIKLSCCSSPCPYLVTLPSHEVHKK